MTFFAVTAAVDDADFIKDDKKPNVFPWQKILHTRNMQ